MLMYLYLFGLIVGGVLLGSSLLLGGHDEVGGGDVDADADADAGAEKGGFELDGTAAEFLLWRIKSVRFWTFFLAFFGLTGVLLDGLGLTAAPFVTLIAALAMGGTSGYAATEVIRRFSADRSGAAAESHDYIGKSARVIVPVRNGGVGKVRVQIRGTTVDVLATGLDDEFDSKEEAIIVEMEGTTARIARLDNGKSTDS